MSCQNAELRITLWAQTNRRTIGLGRRRRLQPFAIRGARGWEVFNSTPMKTTAPVIQPNEKTLMGQGVLDDNVRRAVFVDVPSCYRQGGFGGGEGEVGIVAARKVKFYVEAVVTGHSPRIHKHGSVRLVIIIEVGNGELPFHHQANARQ